MIKVYTVKSNNGLKLQVACTPFGVLLHPEKANIQQAFQFGWGHVAKCCIRSSFEEWKGKRYRILGVKMIRGCNE